MHWLYLILGISAETCATSLLKLTDGFTKLGPSVLVVIAYGAAFYSLSLAVRHIPIGIAYALWCGVGIICITSVGYFFYQQKLDPAALVGIGLILAGAVVINLFSKSV